MTLTDATVIDRGPGEALPGPFAGPPHPDGIRPLPATRRLVATQVRALLASTPAFLELPPDARAELTDQMVRVAAYAAELVRDDWWHSARLGQRPVVRQRTTFVPSHAQAAGEEIRHAATDRVGTVTRQTLRAIAFPEFVADLIRSTFRAIVDAGIQQLEAFRALLGNVTSTVDEFEEQNITDNQARDWLVQRYPEHLRLHGEPPRVGSRNGGERPAPSWRTDLGLPRDVDAEDEDGLEEILVPAARRRLAQQRLETLSLLVLMGLNRIVVTGGKIRATMAFHVDASDAARQANATDFDLRVGASGSVGFGPWSASVTTSVGYVSSSRTESEAEINVAADLTGEVELHFRSDAVALERLVGDDGIQRIVSNTPVPAANEHIPWGTSPEARAAPAARRTSARIEAPHRVAPEPPPLERRGAAPAPAAAPATPRPAAPPPAGSPSTPPPAAPTPPAAPAPAPPNPPTPGTGR
jgi:hypothetical protein